MSDIQHEKEVQENFFNLFQIQTLRYIEQLQQFNKEQKQISKKLETQLNQNSDNINKINQSALLGITVHLTLFRLFSAYI